MQENSSKNTEPRRKTWKLPIAFVLLATLACALYVVRVIDASPRTDDAYAYADTISVAPEVNGRMVELLVKDNQLVKKGDVLFRIDSRPFEQAVARAQGTLASLDSEIELTQRSVNAQKLAAAAATASVQRARAAARQAADTLARMEPLLSPGYTSAEQVDQAKTAKLSADAQLNTALLEAQRASAAISGVDSLVARREVVKAEIAVAKLNLEYTTVIAPFNGRVINLKTQVGQFAAAGHPIFTLADTEHWYVIANFRETELANTAPGRKVELYLLNDPSKRFNGVVESVGYGVFPEDGGADAGGLPRVSRSLNWVRVAQRFPVRILVSNPDSDLFRIGASAVAIMANGKQDTKK